MVPVPLNGSLNNLAWKGLGVVTLSASLALPQTSELLIIPNTQRLTANAGVLADMLPPVHILSVNLSGIPQQYVVTGYLATLNDYVTIVFRVSNTTISIINAKTSEGTEFPNTKLTVWYK